MKKNTNRKVIDYTLDTKSANNPVAGFIVDSEKQSGTVISRPPLVKLDGMEPGKSFRFQLVSIDDSFDKKIKGKLMKCCLPGDEQNVIYVPLYASIESIISDKFIGHTLVLTRTGTGHNEKFDKKFMIFSVIDQGKASS